MALSCDSGGPGFSPELGPDLPSPAPWIASPAFSAPAPELAQLRTHSIPSPCCNLSWQGQHPLALL